MPKISDTCAQHRREPPSARYHALVPGELLEYRSSPDARQRRGGGGGERGGGGGGGGEDEAASGSGPRHERSREEHDVALESSTSSRGAMRSTVGERTFPRSSSRSSRVRRVVRGASPSGVERRLSSPCPIWIPTNSSVNPSHQPGFGADRRGPISFGAIRSDEYTSRINGKRGHEQVATDSRRVGLVGSSAAVMEWCSRVQMVGGGSSRVGRCSLRSVIFLVRRPRSVAGGYRSGRLSAAPGLRGLSPGRSETLSLPRRQEDSSTDWVGLWRRRPASKEQERVLDVLCSSTAALSAICAEPVVEFAGLSHGTRPRGATKGGGVGGGGEGGVRGVGGREQVEGGSGGRGKGSEEETHDPTSSRSFVFGRRFVQESRELVCTTAPLP